MPKCGLTGANEARNLYRLDHPAHVVMIANSLDAATANQKAPEIAGGCMSMVMTLNADVVRCHGKVWPWRPESRVSARNI